MSKAEYWREYRRKNREQYNEYNRLRYHNNMVRPGFKEKHAKRSILSYLRLRNKVRLFFGNKCQNCGDNKNLEFHHLYYAPDSITHSVTSYEAFRHPKRFQLLCIKCHKKEHM